MRTKITKNIPALIAAILAGVAGLSNLIVIAWKLEVARFQMEEDSASFAFQYWIFITFVAVLIGIATLVLAFVRFSKVLNVILIGSGFVLIPIAGTLALTQFLLGQVDLSAFPQYFWFDLQFETTVASIGNVLWVLALIAAVVSLLVKPKVAVPKVEVAAQSTPVANQFDPMTGERIAPAGYVAPAPSYVAPPAGLAPSNLPMIALILAFFAPLGAVIVGHISLNQMKQGQISSENLGMAKTGLILGYVFTGLGVILGILVGVLYGLTTSLSY